MATLTFDRVEKIFSGNTHAVQHLNLQVTDGELIVLLGPSGCGKSTILRLVAGLEQITSGTISINDRIVNHIPPERRNTAMVFQNYALYPHKTVRENLAFPLKMLKQDKPTVRKHVQSTAALLGLEKLLDRRPAELSGGQRQRVAMGRALVREPDVFLLDEPLSNLDAKLRIQMRSEIAALQKRLGTTTIYVTHDQVEAMTMGDRLVVLNQGRINQVGTPETLYQRPADVFVASFIGNPGMNLFLGEIGCTDAGKPTISDSNGVPRLTLNIPDAANKLKQMDGKEVIAGLRPEAFKIAEDATGENVLPLQVAHAEELGHENILYLPAPFRPLPADIAEETGVSTLSQTSPATAMQKQTADPATQTIIAARLPAGTKISRGETINIHFDTAACQLFDASGREAVA